MYFTTHLLAGAAVGSFVGGFSTVGGGGFALAAGLISHVALDSLPHHDYRKAIYGLLDLAVGLSVTAYLAGILEPGTALIGALGGALPDLEVALRHCLSGLGASTSDALFPTHSGLLRHPSLRLPWGILIQLAIAAACFLTISPLTR